MINKTKNEAPLDLYGVLEAASGLIVLADRIEGFMMAQKPTEDVRVARKELYAVSVVGRLNAKIMDNMVYEIERRDAHIKILEDIIKILKATDV